MGTATTVVAVACSAGCVAYTVLYLAFAAHNPHMGFHGDFEAAAVSCGRLAVFFAVTACGATVYGAAGRWGLGRGRRKKKLDYDEPDIYSEAVLPGSYSGLRKR